MKERRKWMVFALALAFFFNYFFCVHRGICEVSDEMGEVDLQFIIAGIKHHESLLKDVTVHFEVHTTSSLKDINFYDEYIEIWKDEKVSQSLVTSYDHGKFFECPNIQIFDGEKTFSRYTESTNNKCYPTDEVWIHEGNNIVLTFGPRSLCWNRDLPGNFKLSDLLTTGKLYSGNTAEGFSHDNNYSFSLLPKRVIVDNKLCYVIEGISDAGVQLRRYYLDPSQGFMPLKEEILSASSGIIGIIDEVELKQLAENIWFPMKARFYAPKQGNSVKFNVIQVDVNKNLSDDKFKLEMKSGYSVYDSISGVQYEIP